MTSMHIHMVFRRIGQTAVTILGLAVINFFVLSLAPGDVVDALVAAGGAADEGYAATLREAFGLNQTLLARLAEYLVGIATLDFGYSVSLSMPVTEAIASRLPATLILMLSAIGLSVVAGILLGLLAGRWPGSVADRVLSLFSLLGYATPLFWLGLLMILLFTVKLNLLPSSGMRSIGPPKPGVEGFLDVVEHAVMPVLTLTLYYMAIFTRIMRVSVIEVTAMEFTRTARAKGMSEGRVMFRHVLRNAMLPVLTMLGLQIAGMFGGAVVIETIFAWPGLGRLAFDAIFSRDIPLLMGILFASSLCVVVTNLVVDIAYGLVDPRIERSGAGA